MSLDEKLSAAVKYMKHRGNDRFDKHYFDNVNDLDFDDVFGLKLEEKKDLLRKFESDYGDALTALASTMEDPRAQARSKYTIRLRV